MEQQNNSFSSEKKPKKKKWITIVIFFIIILAIISLVATEGVKWWQDKQKWVKTGFAHDKFPFKMLTEEELVRKGLWSGESQWYNSIPTRTTPEETYVKFRQALIDGNLDKATECFTEEKREEWIDGLKSVLLDQNLKKQMLNDLPEKLEDTYVYVGQDLVRGTEGVNLDNKSQISYHYSILRNNTKLAQDILFTKSINGDWLIDSL